MNSAINLNITELKSVYDIQQHAAKQTETRKREIDKTKLTNVVLSSNRQCQLSYFNEQ
jgi:hypothetical protein